MRQKIDTKSTWLYVLNAPVACLCFTGHALFWHAIGLYKIIIALTWLCQLVSIYYYSFISFGLLNFCVWLLISDEILEILCCFHQWVIFRFKTVEFYKIFPYFFGIRSCPQTSSIITTLCTELNVNYLKNSE